MSPFVKHRIPAAVDQIVRRRVLAWLFVAWMAVVCGTYAYFMLRSLI